MNSRLPRTRTAFAVILTVLVLGPTVVLFSRVWQDNSDQNDTTVREQQGVEYLTALSPLVNALIEDQSTAVHGGTNRPKSLDPAIARIAAVDARLGGPLKTTARWSDLRQRISQLPKATGSLLVVYQAHVEVTDLLLALYGVVQRNGQLRSDADNDLSRLQQAVAIEMPSAVIGSSRLGDTSFILRDSPAAAKPTVAVGFGKELLDVQQSVNALTDDLRAAVDDTASSTLSGSLVGTLDSFRQSIDMMSRGANPGGTPNLATMASAQGALQAALTALSSVTLNEMSRLLDARTASVRYRQQEAIAMGSIAAALVLAAALLAALPQRRRDEKPVSADYGEHLSDDQPQPSSAIPTRRERSGAVR